VAELIYPESYIGRAKKFIQKHPELLNQYRKTLTLLEMNPGHPSLRLHKLTGRFADLYSVSINMSYRISLEFLLEGDKIVLIDVGSHEEIYR
jgi:proteic killer suppression protein